MPRGLRLEVVLVPFGRPDSLGGVPLDPPDDAIRVRDANTAGVVAVPFQHDAPLSNMLCDVVGPRSRRVVDPRRGDRRPGQDRTEEGVRQPREQVARLSVQTEPEPVRAEHLHTRDGRGFPFPIRLGAGDLGEEALPHRSGSHPWVGSAVERVGEALSSHRLAVVEAELPLQLERLRPPAVRDRVGPDDLRNDAASGRVLKSLAHVE